MHAFLFSLLTLLVNPGNENYLYHHRIAAKNGDGVIKLLSRYQLANQACNIKAFHQLNQLDDQSNLLAGEKYFLPVHIYRYDGRSIRTTIGDQDYQKAVRIKTYNEWLQKSGLRKTHYTKSNILWVPHHEIHCGDAMSFSKSSRSTFNLPILGKKYAKVTKKSNALQGHVYYLMAGHGGPDPGALGKKSGQMLCEDEYAYDVTLRLYKNLMEQGAQAYMIVEDDNDGIRDDVILMCDKDEKTAGAPLPLKQLPRLNQRVIHVNKLFRKHQKKGAKKQVCIAIHVDSRGINHRQDVFFYHTPTSKSGKHLAHHVRQTFQKKYRQHRRADNAYRGTVESRNLYVLKNTLPTALYVELANIQNRSDHRRILQADNRQALANWLAESILTYR